MLYIRMILVMGVSLFTTRIILDVLGYEDYGIYNVVGGIVVMFSFLSNTMTSASQRFFAFELGKKDYKKLKNTFSMTFIIYLIIGIVILVLAETIGLWFLNNKMNIPIYRITAANWVYHLTIISFLLTIFVIPYNALIIAHEEMKIFAYVSILEVTLKLIIAFILYFYTSDKLILYSILHMSITLITTLVYRFICKRKFQESKFTLIWDKYIFKTLLSYSGWNLFGALAAIFNNHGVNILLNIFFGPIVNAARSVAYQLNNAVNQFVLNFFKATQPQIFKYFAAGNKEMMLQLVFRSSKFSYFLLFIITMPLILETKFLLSLWLKDIPKYTVVFTQLVVINALIDSLSYSLQTAAQATGNIKKYQSLVGGVLLLNLPISFFFLKFGFPPEITMIVGIFISFTCLLFRLGILNNLVGLSIKKYITEVVYSVILITIISYTAPVLIINKMQPGINRFAFIGLFGLIVSIFAIYYIGMTVNERIFMKNLLHNTIKLDKFKHEKTK